MRSTSHTNTGAKPTPRAQAAKTAMDFEAEQPCTGDDASRIRIRMEEEWKTKTTAGGCWRVAQIRASKAIRKTYKRSQIPCPSLRRQSIVTHTGSGRGTTFRGFRYPLPLDPGPRAPRVGQGPRLWPCLAQTGECQEVRGRNGVSPTTRVRHCVPRPTQGLRSHSHKLLTRNADLCTQRECDLCLHA